MKLTREDIQKYATEDEQKALKESVDVEEFQKKAINKAIDDLTKLLGDKEIFHGFRSEVWEILSSLFIAGWWSSGFKRKY